VGTRPYRVAPDMADLERAMAEMKKAG